VVIVTLIVFAGVAGAVGVKEVKKLQGTGCESLNPSWSPDGKKIAFVSNRHPNLSNTCGFREWRIWIMDADGGNVTLALNVSSSDFLLRPSWSSDGESVIFVEAGELNALNLSTGNITSLGHGISLSPDGSMILDEGKIVTGNMYLVIPWGWNAVWSPDSKKIAYLSGWDSSAGKVWEIYIADVSALPKVDKKSLGIVSIINTSALPIALSFPGELSWSPDGSKIVSTAVRNGSWGVFVINITTSEIVKLAETNISEYKEDLKRGYSPAAVSDMHRYTNPSWSPDGDKIAVNGINIITLDLYAPSTPEPKLTEPTPVISELDPFAAYVLTVINLNSLIALVHKIFLVSLIVVAVIFIVLVLRFRRGSQQ